MFRFYSKPQEDYGVKVKNPKHNARVVVVGEHSEGMLKLAVSRCSAKDHFVKQKGRNMAEGRLRKERYFKIIPMGDCNAEKFIEIAKATVKEVVESFKVVHTEMIDAADDATVIAMNTKKLN